MCFTSEKWIQLSSVAAADDAVGSLKSNRPAEASSDSFSLCLSDCCSKRKEETKRKERDLFLLFLVQ